MRISTKACVVIGALLLAGCGGGSKILKDPQPMQVVEPLAYTSDANLTATLEWIIIRNNPGTWAKNADWDEYLLRVVNNSRGHLEISNVFVFDSMQTRIEAEQTRKALVKASKKTYRRYKKESTKVMAGRSGVGLFATGAAVTVVGGATAAAAAYGSILAGGGSAGAAGAIAGGLILAGPAIAIGGMVRSANHKAVDKEIKRRQTNLPIELAPDEQPMLDLFFPIAPSPSHLEVVYRRGGEMHSLTLDLREALEGLHLQSLPRKEKNEERQN